MKQLIIATMTLVAILLTQTRTQAKQNARAAESTERIISRHLPTLAFTAPTHQHARIKKLIVRDLINGKHETEAALGRATLYFPIFEHYLRKYDLPEELKYIPYVETRLKVRATSSVGAGGLWQFMQYTAHRYQLRVNAVVDDRYDAIRATEAATRFLQDLYVEFDDWLLALAAYNCGPGRVQRAIRQSKSRDFWKVEAYLPAETRRYIPTFISSVYIGKFHTAHGLKSRKYLFHYKNIRILKLRQAARLQDLAKVSDLPVATLRLLNPAYLQGTVPVYSRGNYLILPGTAANGAQRYLTKVNGSAAEEIQLQPIELVVEGLPEKLEDPQVPKPIQQPTPEPSGWWSYAARLAGNHWLAFIAFWI
jgi:membrane-bound lytic murein transglycosylase D